jgi:hypothetical protein
MFYLNSYPNLLTSTHTSSRATIPDELCRLRPASAGLLYAPWPPLRAEEGATPSVLPISRVSEAEYLDRRRRFALLLQCEEPKKDPPISSSNGSDEPLTEHASHAQCIADLKKSTDISTPIELVQFLQLPPPARSSSSSSPSNASALDKIF